MIGFRLLWGLAGPRYARFTLFIRSLRAALDYIRASVRGDEPRFICHNPADAMMIIGMILALAGTAITGWMYTLDAFWGAEWVEETHELLANLLLIMVGVHVVGVISASLRHKENLVRAMISGRKRAPETSDIA